MKLIRVLVAGDGDTVQFQAGQTFQEVARGNS